MDTIKILLLFVSILYANFNEKYEPDDGRIIHGVGQYDRTTYSSERLYQDYSQYIDAVGQRSAIYSFYFGVDTSYYPVLDHEINTYYNTFPDSSILVIGIEYFDVNTGLIPTQAILNGEWDTNFQFLVDWIKSTNLPVFLRPMFEFGSGNAGYHSHGGLSNTDFINLWIHIYNFFENQNVENVAWIWNTVNSRYFDYMDWYPGDEYVDWWGINFFTNSQITREDSFIEEAQLHQKPVMICESAPIHANLNDAYVWDNWFQPYFDKINEFNQIKAFIYISIDWDGTFTPDWGDNRINSTISSYILGNYYAEMNKSTYVHFDEYLYDLTLPVELSLFNVSLNNGIVFIEWTTESEINNLGFNIYKSIDSVNFIKINNDIINGGGNSSTHIDYQYEDSNINQGNYYWYYLEDIDYNGTTKQHEIKKIYYPEHICILEQNYPNPFNNETTIKYIITETTPVEYQIISITGEILEERFLGIQEADIYTLKLNFIAHPTGIYFFKLILYNTKKIIPMILVK